MTCPGHIQMFRQQLHSYRELPLRLAEFGSCHRNEPSGALHGIMRVRAFTQDDAHIFCTPEQITAETIAFCQLLLSVYRDFGFDDVRVKFSDRPPVRAGSDATWDQAEGALQGRGRGGGPALHPQPRRRRVLRAEAGIRAARRDRPRLAMRHACRSISSCRSGSTPPISARTGSVTRPVMLHRAIFGSFERFIAIVIEHYAGKLPLWLAPVQARVLTITGEADAYAQRVVAALAAAGLRAEADLRNEKINYKIREHSLDKTPLLLVVGKREAEDGTVALRRLAGKDQEILALGGGGR